jgi:catechol 2,3-dioxygenase-like lactoylglutathione lyase family enzyme
MPISKFAFVLPLVAALGASVHAQTAAPNSAGISMGHLHLNAADPAAQKKFWVDILGAREAKLGPMDAYVMPGVMVIVKKADPAGPTEGSVVNHVGVKVKDMDGVVAKAKAAGMKITPVNELQNMVAGPDGLKVELVKDTAMSGPVMNHHVHFYTSDIPAMQKWYAETFGAVPGMRGKFVAADLPGVNLSFTKADATPAASKGRALDHIGFEVRDLEAFTKKLEAGGVKFDVPYRKVPALGISIAFFTDPWGTYIELTEGLNKVQ